MSKLTVATLKKREQTPEKPAVSLQIHVPRLRIRLRLQEGKPSSTQTPIPKIKLRFGPLPTSFPTDPAGLQPGSRNPIAKKRRLSSSTNPKGSGNSSTMRQRKKQLLFEKPSTLEELSPEVTESQLTSDSSDLDDRMDDEAPIKRARVARSDSETTESTTESRGRGVESRFRVPKQLAKLISYAKIDRLGPPLDQLPPLPMHKHIDGKIAYNTQHRRQPTGIWIARIRFLRNYVDDMRVFLRLDTCDWLQVVQPILTSILLDTLEYTSADFVKLRIWAKAKKAALSHAQTMFKSYGTVPINTVSADKRGWYWPLFGEFDEEDLPFAPPTIDPQIGAGYATETMDVGPGFEEKLRIDTLNLLLSTDNEDELRLSDLPLSGHDARRKTDLKKHFPMREPHRPRSRMGFVMTPFSLSPPQPTYLPLEDNDSGSSGIEDDREGDTSGDVTIKTESGSSDIMRNDNDNEEEGDTDELSIRSESIKEDSSPPEGTLSDVSNSTDDTITKAVRGEGRVRPGLRSTLKLDEEANVKLGLNKRRPASAESFDKLPSSTKQSNPKKRKRGDSYDWVLASRFPTQSISGSRFVEIEEDGQKLVFDQKEEFLRVTLRHKFDPNIPDKVMTFFDKEPDWADKRAADRVKRSIQNYIRAHTGNTHGSKRVR